MLILIAGISGMVGEACARAALAWGHQVRGTGRNVKKLDYDISSKMEGFITIKGVLDTVELENAVQGVDAIICAYNNAPELVVAGQLALLYAAEKAGVKIFHAASWNLDWTKLELGEHENYDAFIAFKRTAEISSTIRPIYAFTGAIVEYAFCRNPATSPINTQERTMIYFGDENFKGIWVTIENLAEYTIAAVTDSDAAKGGVYHVESFRDTTVEMGKLYGRMRGVEMQGKCMGDLDTAQAMLTQARQHTALNEWKNYIGLAYACIAGKVSWEESTDSQRWANRVKQTGFEEWLASHPDF